MHINTIQTFLLTIDVDILYQALDLIFTKDFKCGR